MFLYEVGGLELINDLNSHKFRFIYNSSEIRYEEQTTVEKKFFGYNVTIRVLWF